MGWDDPACTRYYERFCRAHPRYRAANAALAARALILPRHRVLDFGAGTGRTAEAVLPYLGPPGSVVCYEPAAPMRAAGERRTRDARVDWIGEWPTALFDRVVCGAAIWQMQPLAAGLARLAALVAPGGMLAFNIPSAYLGIPDAPGGGRDPYLCEMAAQVADGRVPRAAFWTPCDAPGVESALAVSGLHAARWRLRFPFTQAALRDWMKIPVLTDALLPDLDPDARARRIDDAWRRTDPYSWRWEGWMGWTAWKAE